MCSSPTTTVLLGIFGVLGVGATGARATDAGPIDVDGNPGIPSAVLPAAAAVTPREAGIAVFTTRAAFLSALDGRLTETFEHEPWTATCDSGAVAAMSFFDFDVTSQPAALKLLRDGCFGNHNVTPGGKRYLSADTDSADVSAVVDFHFDAALHAFGTYLIDLDDTGAELEINGATYPVPATGDGGEAFLGILSAATFHQVTCRIVGGVDSHYSFDDVTYSAGSPGPVAADESFGFESWGRVKSSYR